MRLINKKHCKQYALEVSKSIRGGKFTRVSSDFFIYLDAKLREEINRYIKQFPSVGKTIKAILFAWIVFSGSAMAATPAFNDSNCIRALIGEAGGQKYPELYAHACALRNRGTLQGVYGLSSKWAKNPTSSQWQRAARAWHESSSGPDVTQGADHWLSEYDSKNCERVYRAWLGAFRQTVKVGQTSFYRRAS